MSKHPVVSIVATGQEEVKAPPAAVAREPKRGIIDHESIVVRALLTDREIAGSIARKLQVAHFSDPVNCAAWAAFRRAGAYGGATPQMVMDMVSRSDAGDADTRSKIIGRVSAWEGLGPPDRSEVQYAVDVLRRQKFKADLRDELASADKALGEGTDPEKVLASMRGNIAAAEEAASGGDAYIDTTRDRDEEDSDAKAGEAYATGLGTIDKVSAGGFHLGTFAIFGGCAGTGKTRVVLRWVVDWVQRYGARVLWVSVEMRAWQMRRLAVVAHANSRGHRIDSLEAIKQGFGNLSPAEKDAIREAAKDLWGGPGSVAFWETKPRHSARAVTDLAEGEGRARPFDVVVVDYAGILSPMKQRRQKTEEHADTLIHLERWCASAFAGRGTRLISLWQITRNAMKAGGRFLTMADFAESSAVERTSHWLGWWLRDENLEEKDRGIIGICKNRFGPTLRKGIEVHADLKYLSVHEDGREEVPASVHPSTPGWTFDPTEDTVP